MDPKMLFKILRQKKPRFIFGAVIYAGGLGARRRAGAMAGCGGVEGVGDAEAGSDSAPGSSWVGAGILHNGAMTCSNSWYRLGYSR